MPTYPFVLAHGIARFDFLRDHFVDGLGLLADRVGDRTHYFRNVRSHLLKGKFEVHHADVDFAGPLERRAADLKAEVERVLAGPPPRPKVHIIAHSMGGLDARYMIVKLGMQDRVCSLTTIGTPHKGSSFADWGARRDRGLPIGFNGQCEPVCRVRFDEGTSTLRVAKRALGLLQQVQRRLRFRQPRF